MANGADANKPKTTAAAMADTTPDSILDFASESECEWFIQGKRPAEAVFRARGS